MMCHHVQKTSRNEHMPPNALYCDCSLVVAWATIAFERQNDPDHQKSDQQAEYPRAS